jgi:hypothetical protein
MQLIFQHVRRLDVDEITARRGEIHEQRQPAEVNESLAGVRGIVMSNRIDSIVSAAGDSRWRPANAMALPSDYTLPEYFPFRIAASGHCTRPMRSV